MKSGSLTTVSADALQQDAAILYDALTDLHPGLYRHIEPEEFDRVFEELQRSFENDLTLPQAYLAVSGFLAEIQDGHTYANFYSQEPVVINQVLKGKDKLPFLFRIVDDRMIVTKSAIDVEAGVFDLGTEVVSINGVPVEMIFNTLLPYVKADGGNDGKRLFDLQIWDVDGTIWWFDVFYPLLYPSPNDPFMLEIEAVAPDGSRFDFQTEGISQTRRDKLIEERYEDNLKGIDDLWRFELLTDNVAILQMGNFAMWNSSLDWEAFLEDAFLTLDQEEIGNLIIDIRGNEGGLDIVPFTVSTYLTDTPPQVAFPNSFLAYETVSPELDPYLRTWEPGLKDLSGEVEPVDNGLYRFIEDGSDNDDAFGDNPLLFEGEIFLLVNAGNSSATFLWGQAFRQNGIGTIVGQTTGGNRKGTTGGQFLQLILPNSKIEVDIPLIAVYPDEPLDSVPDAGLVPDVEVPLTVEDVVNGRDAAVERVLELVEGE